MKKDKLEALIKTLEMIAIDVEKDAKEFDGKVFNGKTMAEYMGNHGAAIKAVAEILKEILILNKEFFYEYKGD